MLNIFSCRKHILHFGIKADVHLLLEVLGNDGAQEVKELNTVGREVIQGDGWGLALSTITCTAFKLLSSRLFSVNLSPLSKLIPARN